MNRMESTAAGYPALNERTQHVLKVLVERYIRDGQPVGSRTLSRDTGLDLSPATVRNVMADLEEFGYLRGNFLFIEIKNIEQMFNVRTGYEIPVKPCRELVLDINIKLVCLVGYG